MSKLLGNYLTSEEWKKVQRLVDESQIKEVENIILNIHHSRGEPDFATPVKINDIMVNMSNELASQYRMTERSRERQAAFYSDGAVLWVWKTQPVWNSAFDRAEERFFYAENATDAKLVMNAALAWADMTKTNAMVLYSQFQDRTMNRDIFFQTGFMPASSVLMDEFVKYTKKIY